MEKTAEFSDTLETSLAKQSSSTYFKHSPQETTKMLQAFMISKYSESLMSKHHQYYLWLVQLRGQRKCIDF